MWSVLGLADLKITATKIRLPSNFISVYTFSVATSRWVDQ